MIRIICVCASLFFTSCKYNLNRKDQLNGLKRVELNLIDSLGAIVFDCPNRYDTSFSWTHFSDCNTCHDQKYRFQTKRAAILKETGWASIAPTDSIDRLTIKHKLDISIFPKDTSKNGALHESLKENLKYTKSSMRMIGDTIYKINDRYFSVFTLESVDSLIKKEVLGVTNIKGNDVIFDCELITGKNDTIGSAFVANSISLINSIIIKDGK